MNYVNPFREVIVQTPGQPDPTSGDAADVLAAAPTKKTPKLTKEAQRIKDLVEAGQAGRGTIELYERLPVSAHGRIAEIVEALNLDGDQDDTDGPGEVEVIGARMPVEKIDVYGLTIHLDTLGRAVKISHPDGFCAD